MSGKLDVHPKRLYIPLLSGEPIAAVASALGMSEDDVRWAVLEWLARSPSFGAPATRRRLLEIVQAKG